MNPSLKSFLSLLVMGTAFFMLFNHQTLGVNLTLWGLSLLAFAHVTHPTLRETRMGLFATLAVLIGLAEMLFIDSDLALSVVFAGYFVFAGACFNPTPTAIGPVFLAGISRLIRFAPFSVFSDTRQAFAVLTKRAHLKRSSWAYILPPIAGIILTAFLSGASPVFAANVNLVTTTVGEFLIRIIDPATLFQFCIWLLGGALLTATITLKCKLPKIFLRESSATETAQQTVDTLEAKTKKNIGAITLIIVNLVLFIYNIGDINWIWFHFYLPKGVQMSQLVHEGTNFLIASILFSMLCLLYFFGNGRSPANKTPNLVWGSLLWLVQNWVLVLSVCIRNYRYIDEYGLAYKRIGVAFFLLLTVVGLVTLAYKIYYAKSIALLLRVNTLFAGLLWLAAAGVDWDGLILRTNLAKLRKGQFDAEYHFTLSDHQLPLLVANRYTMLNSKNFYQYYLDSRVNEFMKKYEVESVLSWDPRSQVTYRALVKLKKNLPIVPIETDNTGDYHSNSDNSN